jgi:hypothetical protein
LETGDSFGCCSSRTIILTLCGNRALGCRYWPMCWPMCWPMISNHDPCARETAARVVDILQLDQIDEFMRAR